MMPDAKIATPTRELKPCDCGGKAETKYYYLFGGGGWGKSYYSYHCECVKCGKRGANFTTLDHRDAQEKAEEAWNRRVNDG